MMIHRKMILEDIFDRVYVERPGGGTSLLGLDGLFCIDWLASSERAYTFKGADVQVLCKAEIRECEQKNLTAGGGRCSLTPTRSHCIFHSIRQPIFIIKFGLSLWQKLFFQFFQKLYLYNGFILNQKKELLKAS